MAEANAENRFLADELFDFFYDVWHIGGISRAIREEDPVWLE